MNKFFNKDNIKAILKFTLMLFGVVAIFFTGYFTHYFSLDKDLRSLQFFLTTYKKHYYYADESKNSLDILSEALLDNYSDYYTKEDYEAYRTSSNGSHIGFGFSLSRENDLFITRVVGNSPAYNAGIKENSKIVGYKLEGENEFVTPTTTAQITDYLDVITDQAVTFKIDYKGTISLFTLSKASYNESFVYYTDNTGSYHFIGGDELVLTKKQTPDFTINEKWAYIKLTSFSGGKEGTLGAVGQFDKVMQLFNNNDNTKLIIDLRSNGGGYMSVMCSLCRYLCNTENNGEFLCTTAIYKDGKKEEYKAKNNVYNNYGFEKIIFLANSGSASASEALMGAVLDYDKSSQSNIVKVVLEPSMIGEEIVYKSYGKGIMQTTFINNLTGEAVKLTTAEIRWPLSNICIHGKGLTPILDNRIVENYTDNAITFAQTL
ncbi:MAG: hypothetical protein IKJ19_04375 [Clostridia bacterium]|nr:hypothetical protein [Clostridia bacterium]